MNHSFRGQGDRDSAGESPSPAPAGSRSVDPGLLTWADVGRFIRRNLRIILGASLGLTGLVLLSLVIFSSSSYEGVATLVIAPHRPGSELKAPTAPLEDYQRLLESKTVVAATAERLRSDGVLKDGEPLRIGDEIRSEVVVSPAAEATTLSPMIELVGEASTPEAAAAVANTWGQVFLEHGRKIREDDVGPMIGLIEDQYQEVRARLFDLVDEETRLVNEYQDRLDELALSWDRKLVGARKHTEDLIVEHKAETRRIMEEFAAGTALALSAESSGEEVGDWWEDSRGEVETETRLLQILSLRTQLAQTPRLLVLEKAVSDDGLWQMMTLGQNQMRDLQPVLDRRLVTHETNALYDQLTLRLADVETDLGTIPPEHRHRIQRFSADLERLQAKSVAELAKMLSDRALLVNDLERQRSREIHTLDRQLRMELDQIRADIARQRSLFMKLAEDHDQAGLLEAEQALPHVRLAALAVPPGAPKPRGVGFMALVAAFVGALLGLMISMVREAR